VNRRVRTSVLACALAATGAVIVWGLSGVAAFGSPRGPYAEILDRVAVAQRHATNVPAAVNFDYRGFDTLGEEFILFSAALGVAVLLREPRGGQRRPPAATPDPRSSALLAATGRIAPPGALLVGLYIVIHGWLTPGGGFQGGVLCAACPLLAYLCKTEMRVRRGRPSEAVDVAGGLGVMGYIVVGLAGIAAGGALFENVLPLGVPGDLLSGGTLIPANLVVGIEVTAAFTLVVSELADRALLRRRTPP
jgi:multicomponent Na+:H+ antiporter subunit B